MLFISPRFNETSLCRCAAGFAQTGMQNHSLQCAPCPLDTWSTALNGSRPFEPGEVRACFPCPAHSSTLGLTGQDSEKACKCAAGFFAEPDAAGRAQCTACRPGTVSTAVGAEAPTACSACPLGAWSSAEGASGACTPCVPGSSTRQPGATAEAHCVRPDSNQAFAAATGATVRLELSGVALQGGHVARAMDVCGQNAVPGFGASATADGAAHVFPDVTAHGGEYAVCWCAALGHRATCSRSEDFMFFVGRLRLAGPAGNDLYVCVKGRVCKLETVSGTDLMVGDMLRIMTRCGTEGDIFGSTQELRTAAYAADGTAELADRLDPMPPGVYAVCWCRRQERERGRRSAARCTVICTRLHRSLEHRPHSILWRIPRLLVWIFWYG